MANAFTRHSISPLEHITPLPSDLDQMNFPATTWESHSYQVISTIDFSKSNQNLYEPAFRNRDTMQSTSSTSHQGASALPDRSSEYSFSAKDNSTRNDGAEVSSQNFTSEQSWEPRFDRRHSWSQEDRKHELQDRLLRVDKGSERGFSETCGQ